MIKVYVATTIAPLYDKYGHYVVAADDTELLRIVSEHHFWLVEIVIRGKAHMPLSRAFQPLGMRIVRLGEAWGIRGREVYYCRGPRVEEVLLLRDEFEDG